MSVTEIDSSGSARPLAAYRLSNVLKSYPSGDGAIAAVNGLDLEIARGEFVVIAGPSGSGKSTLLQLLGALDRPTGGEVRFEDRDLAGRRDGELADLRRDRIGFVFQQFNLIPTLTARENVEAAIAPTGNSAPERDATALAMLERVGLLGRANHLPSQLSGGEQQRVAIARALANGPDVVLADEPTGNLDTRTGDAIVELLYRLWGESGLTVVLITHDPAIAGRAPRVIRLSDGRIEAEQGPRAEAPDPEAERSWL